MGGGNKIPTGPFNANPLDSTTTLADIKVQIGTGSVDFLINGLYTITIGNRGVNAAANYKINTINKDNYKYGNKFTANLLAFYRIPIKLNTLSPNIGIGYKNVTANTMQDEKIQYTGSHVTTAILGIEYNLKKIGVGINGQIPIAQNFAESQPRLKFKSMMHITFAI